ncbi:MAG: RlmE family RNA methyltransferase [Candidatus Nealsonbacteria bacterium]|nr:RlmE family RNA methyltransferase [Candidatus Nealsonbacteria bacterium]
MYRKDRKQDPYTILAQKQGYPARSVYKLKEINEKYKIVNKGDRVLDLGCSPGSWLLYISQKVGSKGRAVGIDTEDIKIADNPNISFIKKDIFYLKEYDFKEKFQTVISDLAPKTSGLKFVDAEKSLELAEKSFEIARSVLETGGNFVCKVFENESSSEFFKKIEKHFDFVKRFRPKAVVSTSKEFYIISRGFKGF